MDLVEIKKVENEIHPSWPPIDMSNIDEEYICPKCQNILINVHQLYDCGCRFCFKCLDDILENGLCPCCDTELTSITKVPDKFFQKKINRIQVVCQFLSESCNWKGLLIDYNVHYNEHLLNKKKICEYCKAEFKRKDQLDEHLNELTGKCLEQPVLCPYIHIGCNTNSKNINLVSDLETSQYLDVTPTITENKVLKRKDLEDHLRSNQAYHLNLVYNSMNKRFEKLELDDIVINSGHNLTTQMSQASHGSIDDYGFGSGTSSSMSQIVDFDSGTFYDTKIEPKLAQINIKTDMLETNQNNLIDDFTRLVRANEILKNENLEIKKSAEEYKTVCTDLKRILALTRVNLLSLEEKLLNLENTSHNGTLIWKITNVNEKRQEALSGSQRSFYSPPFFTNRDGYKMCARVYFNGDGNGRSTHLSIFFVLLRGEYDALLSWPFKQKCSFVLIDQSKAKQHIRDSFKPDPNSNSFSRPKSEMNIASGLPLFCPLETVFSDKREFIKENTLFIKIIVDTGDMELI